MSRALHPSRFRAAILAGGAARRLNGLAKGMLCAGGVPIMTRMIREAASAGVGQTVIVANDPAPYRGMGVPVIPDLRPEIGPMAGVEAALTYYAGSAEAVLLLPCDLPRISSGELAVLKRGYEESGASVVFARTGASPFFWHPLCAVVHHGILAELSGAIDRGQRKIRDLWRQIGAWPVDFPDERPFFNVNTLADVRLLEKSCGDMQDPHIAVS